MPNPLIVLKFGGSVLLDEHRLRIAVHEIYRWRRDGYRVIAVVSALAGRTEELIKRCDSLCESASDLAKSALISLGELESASMLGIHLDRAGIPASVLTPAGVDLVAEGNPLDANLVSVCSDKIIASLETNGVVVFPGFVAMDGEGHAVTLGRGGSDMTAIFLSHALEADRCRLIKDVDGLYDRDPASSGPSPLRYGYANFDIALQTDGSIIQHKALRFAHERSLRFELGRFNGTRPTIIGVGETVIENSPDSPTPLRIALCGLGTVGSGVLDLAEQLPELFKITGAACRTPQKHEDIATAIPGGIQNDAVSLASSGADVVVELIGGIDLPLLIARNALTNQSHFVTANKALIAEQGDVIEQLAEHSGTRVLASASVGGVTPVLESLALGRVRSIKGVLNGTGNFILGALEAGTDLADATREAQRLGFAEADPSRDLDGRDSLDKLLVIARKLGWSIPEGSISRESISDWAEQSPTVNSVKHIASVSQDSASVRVEQVDPASELGQLRNEWNAAIIEFEDGSQQVVRGKGAGRWPTSESVFADLLELSRERCSENTFKEVNNG